MDSELGTLDHLLEQAVSIARDAARLIRSRAESGREIHFKGEIDLVTDTDRAAEDLISSRLRACFPGCSLLLEEGGEQGHGGPTWLVDPLDGTTNFAHGFPHVGVSIALQERGEILVGVVADVFRKEVYAAAKGKGARVLGKSGWTRVSVSQTSRLDRALVATGFPYDRHRAEDNNSELFARFLRLTQGIRRAGAAALDMVYVARGWLDGFWEMRLKPWDVAAGALIVAEAGGRVTDYRGRPCETWGDDTVATNGLLHDQMIRVIADHHGWRRP